MKIGILTYQYAMNYGALLQAFALKQYLQSQGHEVIIINYDSSYLYANNRTIKEKAVSAVWNGVKYIIAGNDKKIKFDEFRKRKLCLNETLIKTKKEIIDYIDTEKFDVLIVGSDQVWNPEINGDDDVYYLNFKSNAKKISYAASFGVSEIQEKYEAELKEFLMDFVSVSVREKTGKEILCKLGLNSTVVLDPVFLPERAVWERLAGEKKLINKNYILCYVMPGDVQTEKKIEHMAKYIKKITNKSVIFLGRKEYKKYLIDGKDIISASPEEFVNLFKYADFIITNSFHGTAFSVIFNKNFYTVVNSNVTGKRQLSSRLTDLLNDIDLNDRIIDVDEDLNGISDIDYSAVKMKLDKLKNISENYLTTSINEEK